MRWYILTYEKDPYVVVEFNGTKKRTKTHKKGGIKPTWGEAIVFEAEGVEEMKNDTIKFKVYD